jgi:hypothetical protein
MGLGEKWKEWRQRQTQAQILGRNVPLTPAEIKEVKPDYQSPLVTRGGLVGTEVLSLAEQIQWVKQQLAQVRNGAPHPTQFPNADVLYWYQIATTRPADFDKIVLKIETPGKDAGDGAWMRDGEYQFSQIESQLKQAVQEVGNQLREIEREFETEMAATLDGPVQAGSEGPGLESAVSA